jgi:hypothetical protein
MTYSRLARHLTDPTTKTVETQRRDEGEWDKQVIDRADRQCEWVAGGARCTTKTGLKARSFKPGSKKPEDGSALCPKHFDLKET